MATSTQLKKVFQAKTATLDELKEAKAIYKKIAEADYQKGEFIDSRFARNILTIKLFEYLDNNEDTIAPMLKTVFMDGNKFNANLAEIDDETGELNSVINIRVNESNAKKLIKEYDFYLNDR